MFHIHIFMYISILKKKLNLDKKIFIKNCDISEITLNKLCKCIISVIDNSKKLFLLQNNDKEIPFTISSLNKKDK